MLTWYHSPEAVAKFASISYDEKVRKFSGFIFFFTVFFTLFLFSHNKTYAACTSISVSQTTATTADKITITFLIPTPFRQVNYRIIIKNQNKTEVERVEGTTVEAGEINGVPQGKGEKTVGPFTDGGDFYPEVYIDKNLDNNFEFACSKIPGFTITNAPTPTALPTPTPTSLPTPTPTKGPCSKDDQPCNTDSDCKVLGDSNQCENYHCIATFDPNIGQGKFCQFRPGFIVTPTPTPPAPPPPPPCAKGKLTPEGKCTEVDTGLGIPIKTEPADFIKSLFGILLGLSGGIALLLIIASGYRLMASQGNPEKLQGAKEMLTSAIVGLLFIIFSFVILQVIGVDILRIPGFNP